MSAGRGQGRGLTQEEREALRCISEWMRMRGVAKPGTANAANLATLAPLLEEGAEPGAQGAEAGPAAEVIFRALYAEGYCEMTTDGRLCEPNGHAPGCAGKSEGEDCDCWVMAGYLLLSRVLVRASGASRPPADAEEREQ